MESTKLHNYYENLVLDHILYVTGQKYIDPHVEDIACIALNQLPPRYVRHDIDMAFYLSPEDRKTIELHIDEAVAYALKYVSLRQKSA